MQTFLLTRKEERTVLAASKDGGRHTAIVASTPHVSNATSARVATQRTAGIRATASRSWCRSHNRGNVEGESYNYDYSESAPTTGLPIFAVFGIRAEL